jgi:hypothetical protein
MRKPRAKLRQPQPIPRALRVFAWNLGGRLTTFGKKQIALNVIERGRAWHWSKLPKGWFDPRGFARDLIDLFAIDQQRSIDWRKLLAQAARASDNDYNPAEFLWKLQSRRRECAKPAYAEELPLRHPPAPAMLREFIERLMGANRAVAQVMLQSKPTQP